VKVALVLFLFIPVQSYVMAQDVEPSGRRDGNADRSLQRSQQDGASQLNVDTGYVFVNGEYIPQPYHIEFSESDISINESTFDLSVFDAWKNEKKRRNGVGRSHAQQVRRHLRNLLERDGSLVLFEKEPFQAFSGNDSYDVLNVLINAESRQAFNNGERDWLPSGVDETAWATWISEFECPQELRDRASEMLARVEQLEESHANMVSARHALESSAYPLTVVGMLLVVMAFGHLLSFKPGPDGHSPETPVAKQAVIRSLALVMVLSALDLIWTLLVSRAGDMKELNPLGAAVIDDPLALIALKTTATALAVALLFGLRQHRVAQQGAWWACLICTLLTVRWLTFNSMFA
jgi:hypothetical protein